MRKVCVVVGSRANYSSIKSAMRAVEAHPDLRLQLVVGASALLDRYGSVADLIERGDVTPVVGRTFPLVEAADALRLIEGGHAAGKVVVTV